MKTPLIHNCGATSALAGAIFCVGLVAGFAGCSGSTDQSSDQNIGGASVISSAHSIDTESAQKLAELRAERNADDFASSFSLGSGDVIQISAPDLEEFGTDRQVRISPEGTVELPIVGVMPAAGLTDQQFSDELRRRLAKYVKDPQVEIFVKDYFGRDVAVVGAVPKPGLYDLTSPGDTLLDALNRAGGMTDRNAGTIILIPANSTDARKRIKLARAMLSGSAAPAEDETDHVSTRQGPAVAANAAEAAGPAQPGVFSGGGSSGIPMMPMTGGKQAPAIEISLATTQGQEALDIPARPGDVIIVPGGGQVLLQGWVRSPGGYAITPGMTVVGAITAAGGEMFSKSATLLRASADGRKTEIPVDLAAVEKGRAPDIQVESGDVIIVNSSATGAVPYLAYSIFMRFGTGVSAAAPIM